MTDAAHAESMQGLPVIQACRKLVLPRACLAAGSAG